VEHLSELHFDAIKSLISQTITCQRNRLLSSLRTTLRLYKIACFTAFKRRCAVIVLGKVVLDFLNETSNLEVDDLGVILISNLLFGLLQLGDKV